MLYAFCDITGVTYYKLCICKCCYILIFQIVPTIPSSVSGDLRDFLQRCLEVNEQERWTAESLLSHTFISNTEEDKVDENKNPGNKVCCEWQFFKTIRALEMCEGWRCMKTVT